MKMNDDYLTGAERESVEELMDLCLKKMDDRQLEDVHQLCLRRIRAVEAEIALRKQEQPKEEGGFAA